MARWKVSLSGLSRACPTLTRAAGQSRAPGGPRWPGSGGVEGSVVAFSQGVLVSWARLRNISVYYVVIQLKFTGLFCDHVNLAYLSPFDAQCGAGHTQTGPQY